MSVIKVQCIDQKLIIIQSPTVASGGMNEDKVHFDFCSKWDGFAKTAIFYRDEKKKYAALVDPSGNCIVPWEVVAKDGILYFGVFGNKDGVRRTSEILRYKVKKGAWSEDAITSEPSPDIYQQFAEQYADFLTAQKEFIAEVSPLVLDIDGGTPFTYQEATDTTLESAEGVLF